MDIRLPIRFIKFILCVVFLIGTADAQAEIVRRAAFDFGSGKIKLQVADVDTEKHTIVQTLHAEAIFVLMSEDVARHPDSGFSEGIQKQAIAAAQNLKQKAIELGAVEFVGLATEAYRKAPNGQNLVDRYHSELDIPVKIISQEKEGEIGFLSLIGEKKLDPTNVISWDIGGGSFQITYLDEDKQIQTYMAPFGRMTAKNAVIQSVKGEDPAKVSSPNPMSLSEWKKALTYFDTVLPKVPPSLALKLKKRSVQLIGMSAHPEQLRSLKTYNSDDILEILQDRLNKNDEELAKENLPVSAVTELVLVYSVMHKLNVSSVNYIRTSSGSTSAILIAEEYWK